MLHLDPFITAYLIVLSAVMGAVLGSFLNCMSWRMAHGESVLKGRSHCPTCNHELSLLDLIPVFSWLFLRGKCRYCKSSVSPRYLISECVLALAFVLVLLRYDVTIEMVQYDIVCCLLFSAALVDLETFEIPDRFVLTGIIVWVLRLIAEQEDRLGLIKDGLLGAFIVAALLFAVSLIFDRVLGKEALGGGDIKLFFMTGLHLGLVVNFFNLILTCVIGLIFAVVFLKRKQNEDVAEETDDSIDKKAFPLGPAIAVSTVVMILVGKNFAAWYLGLIGL